jgi:hypothetical protein
VARSFVPAARRSHRTNVDVNFHHTDSGFTFASNIEGTVEINDPIDEPTGVVHSLILESKVASLKCLLATDESHSNAMGMKVLDLELDEEGKMNPLRTALVQTDQEYMGLINHLPCPLFFMLVAELIVIATPTGRDSRAILKEFHYPVRIDSVDDAHLLNPSIIAFWNRFRNRKTHFFHRTSKGFSDYEVTKTVEVHLCASFNNRKEVAQPYLTVCQSYL